MLRFDLELWLWARGALLANALTDDELVAGVAGKDRAAVQELLRDRKLIAQFSEIGRPPVEMEKIMAGEPVRTKPRRIWFVKGETPARVAAILKHRAAQQRVNARRDKQARNARERQLYAESVERREKAKQRVRERRKTHVRRG